MSLLSSDFLFRNAVGGGLLIAVLCALLGVYLVVRRLELLGVALPQASAAGIALAFWASGHGHEGGGEGHAIALAGSFGGAFLCLALLALARRSPLPAESRLAALYALASAATVLLVAGNPRGDLELSGLLRGELLAISDADLALLATASVIVGLLFLVFRREILLASVDPDFARTLGKEPARADALLYALLGAVISLGVTCAGPLVVFGFLVLPALAGLRLGSQLAVVFLTAGAIAASASVGGFVLAYRVDLPAGPVEVTLAALPWVGLLLVGAVRWLRGGTRRVLRGAPLLLLLLLGNGGCARFSGGSPPAAPPAPGLRGSFPPPAPEGLVAVLPVRNETGEALHLASSQPLADLGRALGDPFAAPPDTVPELLTRAEAAELSRRGVAVRAAEQIAAAFPDPPPSIALAASTARRAGLPGPLLVSTLRRYVFTESRRLQIWLELALVDAADGRVLWSAQARRPIPLEAARTQREVVADAIGPLFDEALGTR